MKYIKIAVTLLLVVILIAFISISEELWFELSNLSVNVNNDSSSEDNSSDNGGSSSDDVPDVPDEPDTPVEPDVPDVPDEPDFSDVEYWESVVNYDNFEFRYVEEKDGYLVSGKSGKELSGLIVLPSVYQDKIVYGIDMFGFSEQSNITKIYFPKTITYIGYGAFAGCYSLNKISKFTAESITIETFAFAETSLRTVYILSDNVTLSDNIFQDCDSLEHIYFKVLKETINGFEYAPWGAYEVGFVYGYNPDEPEEPTKPAAPDVEFSDLVESTVFTCSCTVDLGGSQVPHDWNLPTEITNFSYLTSTYVYEGKIYTFAYNIQCVMCGTSCPKYLILSVEEVPPPSISSYDELLHAYDFVCSCGTHHLGYYHENQDSQGVTYLSGEYSFYPYDGYYMYNIICKTCGAVCDKYIILFESMWT